MSKGDKKIMLTADLHCSSLMSKVCAYELDGHVFKTEVREEAC